MTTIERSVLHLPYDAEEHRSAAHRHGMAETLKLIIDGRPGSALRRLARTTTDELACMGLPSMNIPITVGMTRVIHARRVREARAAVSS